jgi:Protein of unknown function (DUF3617)
MSFLVRWAVPALPLTLHLAKRERLMTSRIFTTGLAAVVLVAASSSALALHGKAGLWSVSVKVDMAGMPQIPPEQLAKMNAMGIHIPMGGDTITTTHCVTPAEAAMDKIPTMSKEHQKYCAVQNLKSSADGMSADMICTGKVEGNGHMTFHFDSPEHYVGSGSLNAVVNGHPMKSSTSFEARWVSAECKADH